MPFDSTTARPLGDDARTAAANPLKRPTTFDPGTALPSSLAVLRPKPADAEPTRPTGFAGSFAQGFKRTLPQTRELLGAAQIGIGQLIGSEGTTQAGVERFTDAQKDTEALQGASLHDVTDGDASVGQYVGDVLGNFGGQAVQSLAAGAVGSLAGAAAGSTVPGAGTAGGAITGAVGGLIGRKAVMAGARKVAEEYIAGQVEKGVARNVAEKAASAQLKKVGARELAKVGAVAAPFAINAGQEIGSAVENRLDTGVAPEDITRGQAAQAIGFGVAAGALDTATEGLNLGKLLRPKAGGNIARRVASEGVQGAIREGATEAAQSALERAGGGASLTDEDARHDYLESGVAGIIGGGVIGGAAGVRRPRIPNAQPGSLSDAANAVPDASQNAGPAVTSPLQRPKGPLERAAATTPVPPPAAPSGLSAEAQQAAIAAQAQRDAAKPTNAAIDPALSGFARMDAEANARNDTRLPIPAPTWIDTQTGEIRKPAQEELNAAMAQHFQDQMAQGKSLRISTPAFATAWNATQTQVKAARADALRAINATGGNVDAKELQNADRAAQQDADQAALTQAIRGKQPVTQSESDDAALAELDNVLGTKPANTVAGGVPTMITSAMKREPKARGIDDAAIAQLTPQAAWQAIKAADRATTTDTTHAPAPTDQQPTDVSNAAVGAPLDATGQPAIDTGASAGTAAAPADGAANTEPATTQPGPTAEQRDQRLSELRAKRKAGEAFDPATQAELLDLMDADRTQARVAGSGTPINGVRNITALAEGETDGTVPKAGRLFVDADNFKRVNDQFGHGVGDSVIKTIGEVLSKALPDQVYHRGGDEFVIAPTDEATGRAGLEAARAELSQLQIVGVDPAGNERTQQGIGVSYGYGTDTAAAEQDQYADKERRAKAGLRSDRTGPETANRRADAGPVGEGGVQAREDTGAPTRRPGLQGAEVGPIPEVGNPTSEQNQAPAAPVGKKAEIRDAQIARLEERQRNQTITAPQTKELARLVAKRDADVPAETLDSRSVGKAIKAVSDGAEGTAYTGRNEPIKFRYALVDATQLVASNQTDGRVNPAYPVELQPRDRTSAESITQVQRIAGDLTPARLGESPDIVNGAPLVGADGIVESGNGRVMALATATKVKRKQYVKWLTANAEKFGIDPASISATNAPVLVRVRQGNASMDERARLGQEGNRSTQQAMNPVEVAKADARVISDDLMSAFRPSEDGDVLAASNSEFLQVFAKQLGGLEAAGLSADGKWTKQMRDRVNAAVFWKAYGDERLLQAFAADADADMKNVLTALSVSAREFAQARAFGAEAQGLDAGKLMADSVAIMREAREKGMTVQALLDQSQLFADARDPAAVSMAQWLGANARAPRRLGEALAEMGRAVRNELESRSSGDMFGRQSRDLTDIADETRQNDATRNKPASQSGLFTAGGKARASDEAGNRQGEPAESGRAQADAVPAPVEAAAAESAASPKNDRADPSPAQHAAGEKIVDVGEKIGGARKDISRPLGPKGKKAPESEVPGWARRFRITQTIASSNANEVGKWAIFDDRKKERFGIPRPLGRQFFDSQAEAEAALPLIALAMKHRVRRVGIDGKFEIVRDVTDRKRVRVVNKEFDTEADAMRYMAANAVDIIETKTGFGEEILPRPETVNRKGTAYRTGDVVGDDFKTAFGFRGVEFGDWNNQEERQVVMNHAFDALSDLAAVMNVPPAALGLDGELALAFGARGHGLSGARAHYELDYSVMNLTKMQGAGSLAHEWFHALDHYLGRQDGKVGSTREPNKRGDMVFPDTSPAALVSHGFSRNSQVRHEVKGAYESLIKAMFKKAENYVEDATKVDRFLTDSRKDVVSSLQQLRGELARDQDQRYYKRFYKAATAEQLAEWDAISERIIAGEGIESKLVETPGPKTGRARGISGIRWSNDAVEALSVIWKQVRGRAGITKEGGPLKYVAGNISGYASRLKILADAESGTEKTRMVATEFLKEATSIDQGRSSEYFATPHEMAARAFQAYVEDRIEAAGGKSDFLSYGTHHRIETPWGWKQPYPSGTERKLINAEFDKFVAVLKTQQTDKGVALFDMPSNGEPVKPHTVAIGDAIRDVIKTWGPNRPRVRVMTDGAHLAQEVPAVKREPRYLQARGLIVGDTVYLVASNLETAAAARSTLAHEAVGHYGVDRIIDEHVKGGWSRLRGDIAALRASGKGSEVTRQAMADTAKRYPNASDDLFAREFMAVASERGIKNGLVDRWISAVRAFLRTAFPGLRFSDAELRQLLVKSDAYLRADPARSAAGELATAQAFSLPDANQTETPEFKRWFGKSAVVDSDGKPLVVYKGMPAQHGGPSKDWKGNTIKPGDWQDTTVIDNPEQNYAGFFTSDRAVASRFAEGYGTATDSPVIVVPAYLQMARPFIIDAKGMHAAAFQFEGGKGWDSKAFKDALSNPDYDGVVLQNTLDEGDVYIPKLPTQIKSAIGNTGQFDATNPDIRFSLPEADKPVFYSALAKSIDITAPMRDSVMEGQPLFSLPTTDGELGEAVRNNDKLALDKVKAILSAKKEDLLPNALKAIQLTALVELMQDHRALKAATDYNAAREQLAADRSALMVGAADADEHPLDMLRKGAATIHDEMKPLVFKKGLAGWFGKRKPEAQRMFDLMLDGTKERVDFTKPYEPEMLVNSQGEPVPWTKETATDQIRALMGQIRGRSADDKGPMYDKIKHLRGYKKREAARRAAYPKLVARYQALPEAYQKSIREQVDFYKQLDVAMQAATVAKVKRMKLEGQYERQMIELINQRYGEQRTNPFYVPLDRNGDHWISYTLANGERGYEMFENAKDVEAFENDLRAAGGKVYAQGLKDGISRAAEAVPGTFMADAMTILRKGGAPANVQDEMHQLWLRTLPESSLRKRNIHRKMTPGYSRDGFRTFAKVGFHGAHQLAKLRHVPAMESALETMTESMNGFRQALNPDESSETHHRDVARGDMYLSNLKERHDYNMKGEDTGIANTINGVAFAYYIGASLASPLVNLTQIAVTTFPVLGSQYGFAKAGRMLQAAFRDSARTGGNMLRVLKSEEDRLAYKTIEASGTFERTRANDLAGQAHGSKITTNPLFTNAMKVVSYLFHKSEVVNRESSAMAAFRLARLGAEGHPPMEFDAAVRFAISVTNGTHIDYSAENRPPIMRGNTMRIITQFKNYSIGMTWLMGRNLYKSFANDVPADIRAKMKAGRTLTPGEQGTVDRAMRSRNEARKMITAMMGVTSILAGSMGLPMINLVSAVASAAHAAFGDDDDPWDFDIEFRAWLQSMLGETGGKIAADGLVNQLTGINVASRTSLSNLWLHDNDRDSSGADAFHQMTDNILGPTFGIAKNAFVGMEQVGRGNVQRGVETMMPKVIKDAMKGLRFSFDGAQTLRGDPIVDDISGPQALIQALGFQPVVLGDQYRENSALMTYQKRIQDRRQSLLNGYAMALRFGDDRAGVMEKIRAFNQNYPEIAITTRTIQQSLKARKRYSDNAEGGISLNKKLANRLREQVTPSN